MKNDLMKYYLLIGEINNIISNSSTVEEAFKKSLRLVVEKAKANHAVLWYKDKENVLHPYYSICSKDLTKVSFKDGEGIVGKVFKDDKSLIINNYKNNKDEQIEKVYSGIDICSYVCCPVSDGIDEMGVLEVISETKSFTEDELNILEMLPTMIVMRIKSEKKFAAKWEEKESLIIIKDIEKSFTNGDIVTKVLKGINLNVYKGEFVVLLGESGCGKSTLLNIVGGMDKADSGSIIFQGEDLTAADENKLTFYRRENIGFIFQSYNLMPNLSVEENLKLIAELVKDPMDIGEALKLVGLYDKRKNYPNQLSGGQQQRVSIARALIKKPTIIMADEPTAALDYATSIEVLTTLEDVCKNGTTLLMVTHNEEIAKMADRVVKFRSGKVFEITVNPRPLKAKDLVW